MSKEEKRSNLSVKTKRVYPHYLRPARDKEPARRNTRWGAVEIEAVNVHLRIENHCYTITGDKFFLDSRGYECMVGGTGSVVITPGTIAWEDGERVRNPYPIKNDKNEIIGAACKKVNLGVLPTGDIMMTERYCELTVRTLWLQHLKAKLKRKNCKDAGRILTLHDYEALTSSEREGHARIILHEGNDGYETIVMMIKLSHPEIMKAMDERLKLTNDIVKRVETIVYRLTCSHSPITKVDAIPKESIAEFKVTGETWAKKYFGGIVIPTYRIGHTGRGLDLLAIALSCGDTDAVTQLMGQLGEDLRVDQKVIPEAEAVEMLTEGEIVEDSEPDKTGSEAQGAQAAPAEIPTIPTTTPAKDKPADAQDTSKDSVEPSPDLTEDPQLVKEEAESKPAEKDSELSPGKTETEEDDKPTNNSEPSDTEVGKALELLKRAIPVIPPDGFAAILEDNGLESIEALEALGGQTIITIQQKVYATYINKKKATR